MDTLKGRFDQKPVRNPETTRLNIYKYREYYYIPCCKETDSRGSLCIFLGSETKPDGQTFCYRFLVCTEKGPVSAECEPTRVDRPVKRFQVTLTAESCQHLGFSPGPSAHWDKTVRSFYSEAALFIVMNISDNRTARDGTVWKVTTHHRRKKRKELVVSVPIRVVVTLTCSITDFPLTLHNNLAVFQHFDSLWAFFFYLPYFKGNSSQYVCLSAASK